MRAQLTFAAVIWGKVSYTIELVSLDVRESPS